jgi:hypothetical protein
MKIQLHQLANVSNNSRLTQQLTDGLNGQLNDKTKQAFIEWLQLVKVEQKRAVQSAKKKPF